MKNKTFKSIGLAMFLTYAYPFSAANAQSMYVKESNGMQTAYSLVDIRKMNFSSGNLTITKMDNSNSIIALNSLKYISFTDYSTTISEYTKEVPTEIKVYPNPIFNELNIDFSGTNILNGKICILSIEGKLIKTQQLLGSASLTIDMSNIPQGVYLCRFSNEKEIKTIKIIKQ